MASNNGGGGEEQLQKMAELSETLEGGERILAPTRRPDGTLRKPIRIRAGYVPQDEVAIYQSKGALLKKEMASQVVPPGSDPPVDTKLKTKSAKRNERKKEKRLQAALEKGNNSEAVADDEIKEEDLTEEDLNHGSESVKSLTSQMTDLAVSQNPVPTPPLSNSVEASEVERYRKIKKKKKLVFFQMLFQWGKNEDQNLQQREQSLESGNNQGHPECWMVVSRLSNEFSFRCVFVLFLSLSVLLPGIFWILPFRSLKSGFDAKQAIKLSAPVHAYFKLQKPVSELVQHIEKLEYDIYEEIGVPETKVAILSMHHSGASNSTDVVFGVLSDPINSPINPVSLSVLRSSLIELFLWQSNLTLTTIFGQPSEFEILKFPGGITIIPVQTASIWQTTQILFNFTLNNSISEIEDKFIELKDQLKYGLSLRSYENLFVQLTNENGSTISSPVIVQASVMSDDFGNLLPQRLKQLAQTITDSPAKNLGLNNSVFGKVKSISLSSYLKGTLHATPPSPSPAPSPGPSISPIHSPASSPKSHHLPPCPKCKAASPSAHSPLHSPGPGSGSYHSLPPSISPAPSNAVTHPSPPCPYSRPAVPPSSSPRSHSNLIPNHPPLLSPQSQLSPDLPPLASVSYGAHPGQGMDSTKGPVSAPLSQSPLAQSPSSIAVRVLPKEFLLLGFLGVLMFHLPL